jgi:hypothetical protein
MFSKCVYAVIAIFVIFANKIEAQVSNLGLEQNIEMSDSNDQTISLRIANQNFLRNNEYFHDIANGYTLFGSLLQTNISYQPHKHLIIQGGVFIRKDFGNGTFKEISPILSLKYQKNNFALIVGNLEANFSHRLIEPIFNFERFVTNNVENGIQLKFDNKRIWTDTWINWEVMQYNQSNYQEEFTAGYSSQFQVFNNAKSSLTIPIQGLLVHQGGQIDTINQAVQTKFNLALGFDYKFKFKSRLLKELNFQNYYLMYREAGNSKLNPYTTGEGVYLNAMLNSNYNLNASVSYWFGKTFLASRGGDLFQSVPSLYNRSTVLSPLRQLLFVRLLYQKLLFHDFYLDLRLEPYFDINNNFFEHAQSVYITYRHSFSLSKVKIKTLQ